MNACDIEIFTQGSVTEAGLPKSVIALARRLALRHGPVSITSESSGIHIYIPDPELLITDGDKELVKRHLSINAEKYLGIGRYSARGADTDEQKERNKQDYLRYRSKGLEVPCAVSMKTGHRFSVADLLHMMPLEKRKKLSGFNNVQRSITLASIRKNVVYDRFGNLVPDWVGETVPLHELPDDHPAIVYLKDRGYDPLALERQMDACYCIKAKPVDPAVGRFYRRLPGGMTASPQGRIVLSVLMNGVRWGYQSRMIDRKVNGQYFVWGDDEAWHLISVANPDGTITELFPRTEANPNGFDPPKYLNATGSERNKLLMGYDAAVEANSGRDASSTFCVLCEGPLDAAKLGSPAIAILGKSLSDFQADALAKQFNEICTVMDNDEAGRQCLNRIRAKMRERGRHVHNVPVPGNVKDAGDLSYEEAAALMRQCDPLTRTKQCRK